MKNFKRTLLALLLVLTTLFCLAGCKNEESENEGFWDSATYKEDVTLGEGSKTVKIDVEIDGKSVTITLNTDAEKLGDALYGEELINDASFFDTLNGIKLDWNTHKAYWGFYKGEEYMQIGVGDESISGGEHYRFVYTK